jgi:hypothetical protein
MQEAASASARDALDRYAACLNGLPTYARSFDCAGNGRGSFLRQAHMLGRTVVALQTRKTKRGIGRYLSRQDGCSFARGNAAAVGSNIDFDIDIQIDCVRFCCSRQRLHLMRVIHQNPNACGASQWSKMTQFGVSHDLIGNQNILDTRLNKHGGLTELLAANANRSQRDLSKCNLWAFVTFCMSAKTHLAAL